MLFYIMLNTSPVGLRNMISSSSGHLVTVLTVTMLRKGRASDTPFSTDVTVLMGKQYVIRLVG